MSNTVEIKNPEFTSFENSMTDKEIRNNITINSERTFLL